MYPATSDLPDWSKRAIALLNAGIGRGSGRSSLGALDDYRPHLAKLKDKRIDSLAYLHFGANSAEQRLYDKLWNIQLNVLREVITRCTERGITPYVFKGVEFLLSCFESRSLGMLFDVDLLVARDDIEEVKAISHAVGLRQTIFSREKQVLVGRDVADIARLESNHYELAPFSQMFRLDLADDELEIARQWDQHPIYVTEGNEAIAVVEVDIHHRVALDIESEPLFARATASAMQPALTLSSGDLIWFTVSRFYTEVALNGKRSLRDFAYIAEFIRSKEVDWDVVLGAAVEYDLAPSLFYFLSFVARFDGVHVPADLLEKLTPIGKRRQRDWGWQLGCLFEFVEGYPLQGI
ncbi:nucleotidyltransferase family protein [Bradyrhizobium japonicum]|uniref:nucleotidyltransferase family protein n=1 Tax=Bradyrhizobium japonicum TaxID=375 RepID=UPI00200DE4A4|nr:nucleotidyltransferase family protein [Bradyrhizobium japonicum]UQE03632.1 nucleotidyltransferase family protein [Bradyrhizobium japonicum]